MPTYVYACSACDQTFEFDQRITDDALKNCILCQVGTVKRVIQPVGIAFKGSGFYVNDSVAASTPKEEATKPPETKAESSPTSEPSTTAATPATSEPVASTSSEKPGT